MEVTVAQAGAELLFCNSFLQHHPTPLAGHRQEKTEKKRVPEELFEKLKANFTEEEIVVITAIHHNIR